MQERKTSLRSPRSWRMLATTLLVAVAATLAQTAMAGPRGGQGGPDAFAGPGMDMVQPRHMERLLDSVNASAEQRAQIRQILQAARADLRAQREAGRTLHEQGRALFVQTEIDAAAVEALRRQMLAQHDQASQRMAQALVDASRVLTPDQRKALADRMAQRRDTMDRHRAERRSAEPLPPR